MSESKHAPGPWKASEDSSAVYDSNGDAVAVIFGPVVSQESDANARLIAAAPDLLAAAKHALTELAGKGTHAETLINATITKAEGTEEEV